MRKDLNFSEKHISKLRFFARKLLEFNKSYNLISKSTENDLWNRHILDSAQLVNHIDTLKCDGIADLGSGGGFPGIVLAIFYDNFNFHVKLYEKSSVKAKFLKKIVNELNLKAKVMNIDVNLVKIDVNYITCRAFKKLPYILNISREKCIKKHKIIIMKGKNAQEEINKALKDVIFKYRLEKSITDKKSKIIILDAG
ncbi:MAG: 16S rRNA (guanine(527)-N(7))-methyltransferase RsmG [Pseudomonadota bacterium]|nr:16S rRNA (guanine(527)-N(7))-methyltransferase RsmG [Pseudomonadota bacterium]